MPNVWIVTDGKAGDENQCLGVVEQLGLTASLRRVSPRRLYAALMPIGPIDPNERPHRTASPLAPPFPDLAIASGRRAIPYLRAIKAASGGRCFTVYLKDPRVLKLKGLGSAAADFIWAPDHDHLKGQNVLSTPTSPHRLSQYALAQARAAGDYRIATLDRPRIAVLLGGDSRNHRFTADDIARLGTLLDGLDGSLMVSPSRRTSPALEDAIRTLVDRKHGFYWDGSGDNPYIAILAEADHVIVTADSINMVGEALATGLTVHIFEPTGGTRKSREFRDAMLQRGWARRLECGLKSERFVPVDATPVIAGEIERRFDRHRQALKDAAAWAQQG